jgi:hypothetical protein
VRTALRRRALLVPVLLLALTACSDAVVDEAAPPAPSAPPASAFAEGSCRLAAEDVLAVGRDSARLGDGGVVADEVKDSLRESQDRLVALADSADPTVKPGLDRLVLAIGLVRVRADGNTYESALGDSLRQAYEQVVRTCTTPAAPSAGPSAS